VKRREFITALGGAAEREAPERTPNVSTEVKRT